jgi:hypothetical protein
MTSALLRLDLSWRSAQSLSFRFGHVGSDRNDSCAIVLRTVALDRNLSAIITLIGINGAGIRVGRGRVM